MKPLIVINGNTQKLEVFDDYLILDGTQYSFKEISGWENYEYFPYYSFKSLLWLVPIGIFVGMFQSVIFWICLILLIAGLVFYFTYNEYVINIRFFDNNEFIYKKTDWVTKSDDYHKYIEVLRKVLPQRKFLK